MKKPMATERRPVAVLLSGLLVLSLVLVTGGRASAESQVGEVASATIDRLQTNAFGFKCTVAMHWETYDPDAARIWIKGRCRNGTLERDRDVTFEVETNGCGVKSYTAVEIEDATTFAGQMLGGTPNSCGVVTEVCWKAVSHGTFSAPDMEGCQPLDLGAPLDAEDPWYEGAAGCSIWSPLEPWVTEYEAVTVPGGWAWRSTAIVRVPEFPGAHTLDAYTPTALLIGAVTPATGLTVATGDTFGSVSSVVNSGGNSWVSANLHVNDGGWVRKAQRTVIVTGPVHTGTVGGVPLDWEWRGLGVLWTSGSSFGLSISGSSRPGSHATRPSLATINGSFATYGGHHDPERCHFWWGTNVFPSDTSGYANAAGPLTFRETATPPAPVPPSPGFPDIYIGPEADCPGGETVCIDHDAPPDIPSLPDPEDESCDFSITSPSTWGGQIICALVAIAKVVIGLLSDLLAFLGGLLAALGELLFTLFVPDPSSWGLDGLLEQLNGRAPFSIFGDLASGMGTVASSYESGGACTDGGAWDIGGEDYSITCSQLGDIPGIEGARTFVALALIALTGWTIFGMIGGMVKAP